MNRELQILYAIQGTGNGHVARAREIIPILQKYGRVEVVLSGDQSEVELPVAPRYRSKGLTFIYNSRGGVSFWKTLLKNNPVKIYQEVRKFPVSRYDIIINDFEFITAWACKLWGKPCFGLGHQASFYSHRVPRPKKRLWWGEFILKYYAPVSRPVGLHFNAYDSFIYPPVIRNEIRQLKTSNDGHYCVYLPAFGDEPLVQLLHQLPEVEWHVFSKHVDKPADLGSVKLFPIQSERFIDSMARSAGILTSAGFEAPAEAMYLGKKLAVIPIQRQYEQYCNAAALKQLGVPVLDELGPEALPVLRKWVRDGSPTAISFPDQTEKIILETIIEPALPFLNADISLTG